MLGLDVRFRGLPAEPTWRYSRQIMSHLIVEAQQVAMDGPGADAQRPAMLVLMVHQENSRAIRFYEQYGFVAMPGVTRRNDHNVMALRLVD